MQNNESTKETREKKYVTGAYLLLLATALFWAGTWPLGRWLGSEEIPSMIIAALRYLLVIPCFFLILKNILKSCIVLRLLLKDKL